MWVQVAGDCRDLPQMHRGGLREWLRPTFH